MLVRQTSKSNRRKCLQTVVIYVIAVLRSRLNFSTAWSTNAVSICQSAGLTNVTRVELSRRFLIKVCTHIHPFWSTGLVFISCLCLWWCLSLFPPAKEWRERNRAQRRHKGADWVSVWQYDRMYLSATHHLLRCGNQTTASVWGGHPGEGSCSLGDGKQWSGLDSLNNF